MNEDDLIKTNGLIQGTEWVNGITTGFDQTSAMDRPVGWGIYRGDGGMDYAATKIAAPYIYYADGTPEYGEATPELINSQAAAIHPSAYEPDPREDFAGTQYVGAPGMDPQTDEAVMDKMFGINPATQPSTTRIGIGLQGKLPGVSLPTYETQGLGSISTYQQPTYATVNIPKVSIPSYTYNGGNSGQRVGGRGVPRPVSQPQSQQLSNNGVTYTRHRDGSVSNISGPIKATANPNGPGYVAIAQQRHQLDPSLANTPYGRDWQRLQDLRRQRDDEILRRSGSSVNSDGVYMGGIPDWGLR